MSFPFFQTPLQLAHHFWDLLLQQEDIVIDATCGNGKDAAVLAHLLEKKQGNSLICIDIQQKAIDIAKSYILEKSPHFFPKVQFLTRSHEILPTCTPKLIVYNLGYLPKADKKLTTMTASTLSSVKQALLLIPLGGAVCITCYPGHAEGEKEKQALESLFSTLPPILFNVIACSWYNRKSSPCLFIIQKTTIQK